MRVTVFSSITLNSFDCSCRSIEFISSRKGAITLTWASCFAFIFTEPSVIVGYIMRPITDRFKIPRVKLAYITDAMGAPLATISPLAPHTSFIVSLLVVEITALGLGFEGWELFFKSVPYVLYSWLAILVALMVIRTGEPTGLIKGTVPISRISPKIQRKDMEGGLISLASKFYSAGITTVHTDDFASASMGDVLDVYFSLIRSGKMPIRIVEQARVIEAEDMDKYLSILEENPDIDSRWFKGRVMKVVLDGTLGARTCFVREPFADSEGCGIFIYDEAFLRNSFKRAVENGLQIVAHAIGDGAISKALEIFEELKEEFNSVDPRHGIIHNQLSGRMNLQSSRC